MIYFSLCRLVRRSGEPRWKSERKKIFLPAAICMGKYNSLGIYQENINFFWAVYAHNQGLFYVCRTAGAGSQGNKRGDLVFIFFSQHIESIPDIVYQLVCKGNTDMHRCINAGQPAAFLAGAHQNAAGPGDQRFTACNGNICFGKIICYQQAFQGLLQQWKKTCFPAENLCPSLLGYQLF